MSKLCLFFNIAPKYREEIYRLIDQEYSCDWYFGENDTDIKSMDLSLLSCVKILTVKKIFNTPVHYMKGAVPLLWDKNYKTFLMIGAPYCLSVWLMLFCKKLFFRNKRIYLWTHGLYGKENWMVRQIDQLFYWLADGTFLYGNYSKQLMTEFGFDEKKLHVIHNSLAYKEHLALRQTLKPSSIYKNYFGNDNPTLIFIGRLTPVKRLDIVLHAVAKLRQNGEKYNLVFVGNGVEYDKLKQQTVDLDLNDNVWFYGACYNEKDNAELIYNADLCVSPGNIGLTAIHVLTFGTPAITHNDFAWQMPEFESIKDGITGGFCEKDNIDSLAEVISKWFRIHQGSRDVVRQNCFDEIDTSWTPQYQIKVINNNLKVEE